MNGVFCSLAIYSRFNIECPGNVRYLIAAINSYVPSPGSVIFFLAAMKEKPTQKPHRDCGLFQDRAVYAVLTKMTDCIFYKRGKETGACERLISVYCIYCN